MLLSSGVGSPAPGACGVRVFDESLRNNRLKGSGKMLRFGSFCGANFETTGSVPPNAPIDLRFF